MVTTFVFVLTAAVMLVAALVAVLKNNLVHAAMGLVVTLFGTAVLFVLLEAYFLAVAQVVIYVGAIAILIVFSIMLTRRVGADWGQQTNATWPFALLVAGLLTVLLGLMVRGWAAVTAQPASQAVPADMTARLGAALVDPNGYVVPFEVASVLLLAALIGAVYVAWGGRKAEKDAQG
ncbi:MAG: NADH-quinone oxidoreductase subunit J [Chloroflexi bacterium]|nr:NADH-quinone oxidoreductase subunit J [Chloroflexota bacterium]